MEHRKIAGYTNCVGVYINYGIGQYNGIHDSFGVNWIVNRSGCGCGWGSCTACDGKHIIRLVNVCKWSGLVMHDVNWTDRHIYTPCPVEQWHYATGQTIIGLLCLLACLLQYFSLPNPLLSAFFIISHYFLSCPYTQCWDLNTL